MFIKSKKLFQLFREYKKRKFVFIKPYGNWGDELIFKGAEKLARLAGINYESIDYSHFINKSFSSETILYIHGGGGFNNIWQAKSVEEFSIALSTHSGIVILGPTTFATDKEFLINKFSKILENIRSEKVYIFTRGCLSHKDLLKIVPSKVILDIEHDTALNLERNDLLDVSIPNKGTLFAIRNDLESVDLKKFNPLILWLDPIEYAKSFKEWLLIHDGVEEIITNRLHSAILGSILKKKVTLLPNSYHKNKSLWEFSLKDLDVKWEDKLTPKGINKILYQNKMYVWAVNSYKLKNFIANSYIKGISKGVK